MRLFDFVRDNLSSIKSGINNVVSGARSWVIGKLKSSLASTVDTITESAVNATQRQLRSSLDTIVHRLGVKSKQAVDSAQAVVEQGIVESNQKADEVLKKFFELMTNFRRSLDERKAQGTKQDDSFINLDDGESLYKSLEELGTFLQEGKIKLEEFASKGKSTLDKAKPIIEKLIGEAFVEAVINPILSFFTELVSSFVKSVFQDLSNGGPKANHSTTPPESENHEDSPLVGSYRM